VSAAVTRARMLVAVRTDRTFAVETVRGEAVWVGRCLHCRSRLVVGLDGEPRGEATVEHVIPQSRGGTSDPLNLAVACRRCNHGKGVRHDSQRHPDARALEVQAALEAERAARWRPLPEDG
jgi:5-methylcytosine-specific restriction endonuclease McrA